MITYWIRGAYLNAARCGEGGGSMGDQRSLASVVCTIRTPSVGALSGWCSLFNIRDRALGVVYVSIDNVCTCDDTY